MGYCIGRLLAERLLLGGKVRYHNWWVLILVRNAVGLPNTSFGFKGDKVRVGWLLAYTRGLATISCIVLRISRGRVEVLAVARWVVGGHPTPTVSFTSFGTYASPEFATVLQ